MKLPKHLEDRYEIRDGFIVTKNPPPEILAAMESMKRQMAEETARRDRIRKGLEPSPADCGGQWGIWNISDRD